MFTVSVAVKNKKDFKGTEGAQKMKKKETHPREYNQGGQMC